MAKIDSFGTGSGYFHFLHACGIRCGISLSGQDQCDAYKLCCEFLSFQLLEHFSNIWDILFLKHTRRVFYEYDGSVSHDDSGYYFNYQDRRGLNPLKDTLNLTGLVPVETFCDDYVMCGVPCFSWCGWRKRDGWLPRASEVIIPGEFNLNFLEKTVSEANGTVRLSFQLSGAPHMNIFMQPVGSAVIRDWSFDRSMIDNPENFELPYQVYLACGTDRSPLEFYIEMEVACMMSH